MLINLEKQKLTIGQLKSGKINQNILNEHEKDILNILDSWNSGAEEFELTTSGSTGIPTPVVLSRKKLIHSANTSLDELDPNKLFRSSLLCLSPEHIGGLMVLVRAMVRNLGLTVITPSSDLKNLPDDRFDLTSMVPMQLQTLIDQQPERLSQFKTILLGGGPLKVGYEEHIRSMTNLEVFHTYGMTETASHVALKNLSKGDQHYTTLGDVCIGRDDRECLKLKGTITDHQWLQTNDVVEILDSQRFTWKGRADFVINSGGIKIHPEILEASLSSKIKLPFFVAGLPDDRLGEKLILVIESAENISVDFDDLDKYNKPKETYCIPRFSYTRSNKLDRLKTLQSIEL